jgi:hypothetical protein
MPVGVELAELDPVVQPEAAQCRRHAPAGMALADVVHADVELVPVPLAAEHLAAAAGNLVLFEHQGALAGSGEIGGAGEPAEAGADDDRVPVVHEDTSGCHHSICHSK